MVIQVANSDFYDFDWNKSEECFAVDQIWATFDDLDGMPRFYARITKIHSPFKVDITWLEFVAGDISETAWERSGLPVACGKFKHSKTATIEDVGSFSHKVFRKRRVNETYNIYPRKGETWALYKNWNIKWSSNPENHREYEYEFIVVLSDYNRESGILVGHLVKLKGFVCLFKPTKNNGIMASFQIPSNEMFRFSHRVPSFRTNGKERKGVPEGYYELDPCSLPCDLEEDSGFIDMEPETVDGNIHGSVKSVSKEKHPMLKKRKNPDAESTLDGSSAGGNKSSRMSNGCYKNSNKEKQAAEASGRLLDKCKATNISDVKNNVASHAKEMSPDSVNTIPGSVDDDVPSSPSSLKTFTMPDTEFCKFGEEQSCGKFKTGHIWALYSKLDNFPRNYAQIESVESLPVFKLAVKWLISCDPPRGVIPWADKEMPVSCGTFKVTSGEVVVFENSISFSHQLSELPTVNNVYNIHPRPGEVWALYSKYRSDLTCSDLKKCKYNIVEILEVVGVRWIIVSILERVTSFKTVFKAVERERLDSVVAIPWIELYRFSHQVPSFNLSEARYGKLCGCWELDPRSLSVC
ncbi:hypothetical protein MKW94_004421 [Papaver nudicaule]|uniref:DUF3444 domain-containing protein n=1 Tax=Papaver nudicaule TaxID=74823 RepID=A0AA41VZ24_PAPNU|nr:hypothetical protein [Papaver nudicaule]